MTSRHVSTEVSPGPKTPDRSQSRLHRPPLAVIGIGCRLPGGIDSPPTFWDALLDRIDAIREVPADRWDHSRFHDTNPEKSGCIRNAKGGFIEGVDEFDGEFFGYFPAAAQRMDPQQRLLLEVTHEAMEDAGLRRDQLDGSRTSVFIGSFMYDYLCIQAASQQRDEINPYVAMGTAVSSLANRISYDFNLTGPSVSLDTACSSSLTAMHLACRSVWAGDADLAIAGGVNVILRPESSIMLSKAGFLNPDQYCKAFDASRNGYVRGEGVGIVILKPLDKAIADGDVVYACVRGTAANQDGYTSDGFTVPNPVSQVALLESAYQDADIDPSLVDFVEAHGTGTTIGDFVESMSIGSVMGYDRDDEQPELLIGSVKTNLGHLEGASGITGFIKGALTAHHGVVPPNLHFHDPNPEIMWEHYRLQVPTEPTPLRTGDRPFTVGVNSFGAGGANAHVVLQQPPAGAHRLDRPPVTAGSADCRSGEVADATVYTISSVNRSALRTLALEHADFLHDSELPLGDIAYSAFARRSHYPNLLAVVGKTSEEIEAKLRHFADGKVDPQSMSTTINHKKTAKLAFVFSGQGGQWAQMGLQLMQHEPVFAQTIRQIDSLFGQLSGWSLLNELRKDDSETRVNDTVVVQPAVMAIQVALVELYESYGIRPAGVVGHSIGEVAAAYASGALTIEQAVEVIYHRSQAQDRASGNGGMLAVGLSLEQAQELIEGRVGVSIGAVNGPAMLTLSGDLEPLDQIAKMLESRGIFQRPVKVDVAYHSHHMEPIRELMLDSLADVTGVEATVPLYSTVTGMREHGEHLGPDYWYENVRRPVLFTDTLHQMFEDGFDSFIEVGPHPVLVRGGRDLMQAHGMDGVMVSSMTRKEPELTVFLQSLARLAGRGFAPDCDRLFGASRHYVRLPKQPWQHHRYWYESPAAAEERRGAFAHPFLKRKTELATEEGLAVWEAGIDLQRFPYLHDHQVDGEIVFPATGHIELAWAVAREQHRFEPVFLENLHFDLPLILPENNRRPLNVRLEIVSGEGDYRICSRADDDPELESHWTKHSSGRINTMHDRFEDSTATLAEVRRRFCDADELCVESFYETVSSAGLEYGARFRCIEQLWQSDCELLARLELPADLEQEAKRNEVHPTILDACLHVVFADVHRTSDPNRVFLPYRMDRVRIHGKPSRNVWSHVSVTRSDAQYICLDATIFDESGQLIAEVLGVTCKRLGGTELNVSESLYEGCYEYRWTPSPRDDNLHGRNFDFAFAALIVPDDQSLTSEERELVADLANRLEGENVVPRLISIGAEDDPDECLADLPLDRRTLIIFAAGLRGYRPDWQGLGECKEVPALLKLAKTLHRREGVPRLCVVTRGAAAIEGDEQLDLGQSILHGMSRVINNECPNLPLTVVDLSPVAPPCEVESLLGELLNYRRDRDESEIALRGESRYVRQLMPLERDAAETSASTEEPGCGGCYHAELSAPGALDQIGFRRFAEKEIGDNDVEIAVEAAALNFKDVMNAMGLLQNHAVSGGLTAHRLGLEVAGRVIRLGQSVEDVQLGDEVMARVPEGFCGRVVTSDQFVVKRPSRLSPAEAAAVPLVYITAWYSLCYLARMSPGDIVLVHSAAGGVGGAAIRLAQRSGATVIATAGSEEKREYLRAKGIEHVFDSRSLDFYNGVMDVTDGRGVDIVLNSLTGRFIPQGIKCLAPFGRFVEIGKADVYRNSKLSLERLGDNISYFVVDVDRLALQRPRIHRQAMTEIAGMFERGELHPHELHEFTISQLPEALRFMTRSAYRGKIVIKMEGEHVHTLPPRHIAFRSDRSYLISGGASGFGLEIARWMCQRGARHLVLLSRSGCKSREDESTVAELRESGAIVQMPCADVTDGKAVEQLVAEISPPLAGVIHGAAVLDDASIASMDMERFERVFQPKAQGAWNLHRATVAGEAELDFFITLSSISSVLGLFGQLNYAAANYFQDSLAQYRRQRGLCGTSVNLGVLGQYAGMSNSENDQQDIVGLLESQGMYVMQLADVLAKLEAAIIQQPVHRMTARIDWPWFRLAYPHLVRDARFIELMSDAALAQSMRSKGTSLRTELAALEPDEKLEHLQRELASKLAHILEASPDKFDVHASIDTFGLDSLMLTELQVSIVRAIDVNVPLIKLLKGPSIANLAKDLVDQLEEDATDNGAAVGMESVESDFTLADVDGAQVINPWLIRGDSSDGEPMRLFCFHSMGVGASLFTRFLLHPPDGFDIIAVQTPGRENRRSEPVAESVEELVEQIVPQLLPLLDRPFVVWGHSFGGVVAWEVIRRLREAKHTPVHFVVSGTEAPHEVPKWQKREIMLKAMEPENSAEYLISQSRYVDDPEFFQKIIPGMRRDMPLLRTYQFEECPPLECPISAFAALQDDMVYTDRIRQWKDYTKATFELMEVDGDHWFLDRHRDRITSHLRSIALDQSTNCRGDVATIPTA